VAKALKNHTDDELRGLVQDLSGQKDAIVARALEVQAELDSRVVSETLTAVSLAELQAELERRAGEN